MTGMARGRQSPVANVHTPQEVAMAYKTILVSLNEIAALPRLLAMAGELGRKFDAHVKGLYVIPSLAVYGTESYSLTPVVFDGQQKFFKDRLSRVRTAFEEAMKREGLNFDFQSPESETLEVTPDTIDLAREADLVLLATPPERSEEPIEDDMVQRVALGSGRPVLVIPGNKDAPLKLDHVIVGWNSSREAARAVVDAMPFLKSAGTTHICTVQAKADTSIPGAAIADNLSRHGLKPMTHKLESDGRSAGSSLLVAAKDYGAGLLVMGCYGHNRLAEFVFGGATRHVLRNLDIPVLLSH
jgi:nucleotide-binding universal stress UspA family protein